MREAQMLVAGGGPAGLGAAFAAASTGVDVILCEQHGVLGGALLWQTHKFFHREVAFGGLRGDQVARQMVESVERNKKIEVWTACTVTGFYADGVVTCVRQGKYAKFRPERVVLATGATEEMLSFFGNDLPGVLSAGAMQSLIHAYGVLPAGRALVVGSGNRGLEIAYQLLQAGVPVAAVIDSAPAIRGYWVLASLLRRSGVPILCGVKLLQALGKESVTGAKIARIDAEGRVQPGTEETMACDAICLAAGLSPLAELCAMAGCRLRVSAENYSLIPETDAFLETSVPGVFAAGSLGGGKDAYLAWLEGQLAGFAVAGSLGKVSAEQEKRLDILRKEREELLYAPEFAWKRGGLAQC